MVSTQGGRMSRRSPLSFMVQHGLIANALHSFLSATNVLKQGYIYDADGIRVRQIVTDSAGALDDANHPFARSIHVWVWWYHIYIVLKSIPIFRTGKNPK